MINGKQIREWHLVWMFTGAQDCNGVTCGCGEEVTVDLLRIMPWFIVNQCKTLALLLYWGNWFNKRYNGALMRQLKILSIYL